jgi:hypothetical protein
LLNPPDDRHDVGVPEVLQGLGGEGRAHATGAVDGDGRVLVRQSTLDGELQVAPRQVDRAGNGALFVLLGLAYVEEREVVETCGDVVRVNLGNLGLGGVQQISRRRQRSLLLSA